MLQHTLLHQVATDALVAMETAMARDKVESVSREGLLTQCTAAMGRGKVEQNGLLEHEQ